MTDQEQGAGIFGEQFLEQFQGFDIEVVGRFVQHQHIGRFGEQAGQQQTVTLTTGQRTDRRTGTLRREQEIFQIADHMLLGATDFNPVGTRRDDIAQR